MFGTRVNLLSDWDKRFQLMPCAVIKKFKHHFFSEYHVFLFQCSFGKNLHKYISMKLPWVCKNEFICWEFRGNILDIIVTLRKYKWKSNWPKNQQIGNALFFPFSLLPFCFPAAVHTCYTYYLLDVIKSLFICIFGYMSMSWHVDWIVRIQNPKNCNLGKSLLHLKKIS